MDLSQRGQSYYSVLGVDKKAPIAEIRNAYRKLTMQWHPDKWIRSPSFAEKAKQRFQQIQEAYTVLSDERKRTLYDAGFYDPAEEDDEGFSEFLQEMLSMMANFRREKESYSFEELQQLFMEMVDDHQNSSQWCPEGSPLSESSRSSKQAGRDGDAVERKSHVHVSSFGMFGTALVL